MRSTAPLTLLEQVVMLLVLAWAAAICLGLFLRSDGISDAIAARDGAVLAAQNAAEQLKHHRGDPAATAAALGGAWSGYTWTIPYDAHWQTAGGGGDFLLTAAVEHTAGLGRARITVTDGAGGELFALTAAWQEVDHG